ncbi:MAG: ComEC/Rec2 family competence protein [Paludibacteraceae bacterium]
MNFLLRTPFFRLFVALAVGIVLYQYIDVSSAILIFLCAISLTLFTVCFFITSSPNLFRFRWIFGLSIFLLLLTMGYYLCRNYENKNQFSALGEKSVFQVELLSAPIEKANAYQCKVKLCRDVDSVNIEPAVGNAMLYLQKSGAISSLRIGDKLIVSAEFKTPDGIQNPGGFDYAAYLKRQGILATAYVPTDHWQKSTEKPIISLFRIADIVRNHLLKVYRQFNIDGDEFAVLAALTLGYTDELQTAVFKKLQCNGSYAHFVG